MNYNDIDRASAPVSLFVGVFANWCEALPITCMSQSIIFLRAVMQRSDSTSFIVSILVGWQSNLLLRHSTVSIARRLQNQLRVEIVSIMWGNNLKSSNSDQYGPPA